MIDPAPNRARPRTLLSQSTARSVRAIALCAPLVFLPALFRSETKLPGPSPSCSTGAFRDEAGAVVCEQTKTPLTAAESLLFGVKPDLNQMNAGELSLVPGIGAKLAQRIVEDRERNGPFRSVEEVDRVRGIGPVLTRRLSEYVRVR